MKDCAISICKISLSTYDLTLACVGTFVVELLANVSSSKTHEVLLTSESVVLTTILLSVISDRGWVCETAANAVASCRAVSARSPCAAVANAVGSCNAVVAKVPCAAVAKSVVSAAAAVPLSEMSESV